MTHRVYSMSVASVYPLYIAKAEKKGCTKAEVDEIIFWLTGKGHQFRGFFRPRAPAQPFAIADHRRYLRRPRRGDRGADHARNPLSRQTHRRACQRQGDGEDFACLDRFRFCLDRPHAPSLPRP